MSREQFAVRVERNHLSLKHACVAVRRPLDGRGHGRRHFQPRAFLPCICATRACVHLILSSTHAFFSRS